MYRAERTFPPVLLDSLQGGNTIKLTSDRLAEEIKFNDTHTENVLGCKLVHKWGILRVYVLSNGTRSGTR